MKNHNMNGLARWEAAGAIDRCKAIRYSGKTRPGEAQRRGELCAASDGVQDNLCWTHRKVVELRGVSVEKVLRGER